MTAPGSRKPDKTGRSGKAKPDRFAANAPPSVDESGGFVWLTLEMLESDAWAAMSLSARKVVDRIIIEWLAHGRKTNGELVVTFDNFEAFGIRRSSIKSAIESAVGLGWIDVTVHGSKSWGNRILPSQYALTWVGRADRTPPSNRWRRNGQTRNIYSSGHIVTGEVPQNSASPSDKT